MPHAQISQLPLLCPVELAVFGPGTLSLVRVEGPVPCSARQRVLPPRRRILSIGWTKFDRQVEETAEAVMFGIGLFLGGRDMDGVKRTDATFWRPATRVLPKVEGRFSLFSNRAGG